MPTNQREISKAKELRQQGRSYAEVGIILGRSKGTVHKWLNPYKAKQYATQEQLTRDKVAKRQYNKLYYSQNRDKEIRRCADYHTQQMKVNIQHKLRSNLRRRLLVAIRGNYKSGSAVADLGCSIDSLKQHLESKFQDGMTWANYGKWHIDHVRPLSSFTLTDREQFLEANHYTNLQPLWAVDNLRKGDSVQV